MKRVSVFLALSLFVSVCLFAQTPQELRPGGAPVSGTLREGSEIWYSIRAASNGLLIVETDGNTDTFLEAYDDRRSLITANDDGGEGVNARIEMVVGAGNTYLFKLRGYDRFSTGSYRIWAGVEPIPAATELRFRTERQEYLSAGGRNWYSFRPPSTGSYAVWTTGSSLDTYMYLYDSQYNLLEEDDDGGMGLNARIEYFFQGNQTYFFVVRGWGSEEAGSYNILAGE